MREDIIELAEELLDEAAGGQGAGIDPNGLDQGTGIDPNG